MFLGLPWGAEGRQISRFWRPQLHAETYFHFERIFEDLGCSLAPSWLPVGVHFVSFWLLRAASGHP